MTDLEIRLRQTLLRHDADAPTAREIAERAPSTVASRHRGRLVAVLAATVLVVAGAGFAGLALRHRDGGPVTDPRTGTGQVVFVIDAVPGMRQRDLTLVPAQVRTTGGPSAALRTLFAYTPSAGRTNPWHGVRLRAVTHRDGVWRVEVRDTPDWSRGPAELVMQSLAWTLSAATESTDPIGVDLHGRPLTTPAGTLTRIGVPVVGYLQQSAVDVPWVHRTCFAPHFMAAVAGNRFTLRTGAAAGPTPVATIRVGETVQVLPDRLCFQPVNLSVTPVGDRRSIGTGSTTWTPSRPGRFVLQFTGSMCLAPDFVTTRDVPCLGGLRVDASALVRVTARRVS